jgi:thymidine phosphorylase
MEKMIEAQHGDPRVVADPTRLAVAPVVVEVKAARAGFVVGIDALEIGLSAVAMGAGRTRADQAVDPTVGILVDAKPGARVRAGDPLARVFVREAGDADALVERVGSAFTIEDEARPTTPLVLGRIEAT